MFTTSWEKYPSKPVISSLTAAEAEFRRWLQENHFHTLTDASGFDWHLKTQVNEGPSPSDRSKPFWEVEFQILAQADVQKLVETGTFDPTADARLLRLLAGAIIPMRLLERKIQGHKFEQVRMELAEMTKKCRKIVTAKSYHEEKRRICARWVDQQQLFSSRISPAD